VQAPLVGGCAAGLGVGVGGGIVGAGGGVRGGVEGLAAGEGDGMAGGRVGGGAVPVQWGGGQQRSSPTTSISKGFDLIAGEENGTDVAEWVALWCL
jgi:hypothetical protein